MSIKKMTEVWEHSKADGTALVLLLKLADFANDEGRCWPGIDRLAAACRRSRRQVQRMLSELVALGELEVETNRGSNHTNRYRIAVTPRPALPFHGEPKGDENVMGDNSDATKMSPLPRHARHGGDDAGDQKGCRPCHPIHQEPSVKPKEKALSLSEALSNFLKHCLLPDNVATRTQWQTLARNYGGAKSAEAILDCVCWCIDAAQGDGLEFKYANQVMSYARRWARQNAKASA